MNNHRDYQPKHDCPQCSEQEATCRNQQPSDGFATFMCGVVTGAIGMVALIVVLNETKDIDVIEK